MTYAIVRDVPASWDQYANLRDGLLDPIPDGLLVHVAGPTDEGFRIIDIWDSHEDYVRFRAGNPADVATLAPATVRELEVVTTIQGRSA